MGIKSKKYLPLPALIIAFFFLAPQAYAAPDAAHSTFSATQVPADGATQSTITVTLKDVTDVPQVGDTVHLSNSSDPSIVLAPASAVTDGSGVATFTATSTTAGTDPIDVIDDTSTTTLTALGNIVFDPVPTPTDTPVPTPTDTPMAAPTATPTTAPASGQTQVQSTSTNTSCTNTLPASAPDLTQIVAVNRSATLYFTPPASGYDGFTISYGLNASADTYNVSFAQGVTGSSIKYTVNALSPNTKYYFMVRANNGCAPGPWSTVRSTSGNTKPPVSGSMDWVYLMLTPAVMAIGGLSIFLKYR